MNCRACHSVVLSFSHGTSPTPPNFKYKLFFSVSTPATIASSSSEVFVVAIDDDDINPTPPESEGIPIMKRKKHESNRVFQDVWAAKLPWAESVLGPNGNIHQVRCKVCTKVKGREKLFVPKFDSFQKHVGWRKAKRASRGNEAGSLYFSSDSQHTKNERLFASLGRD